MNPQQHFVGFGKLEDWAAAVDPSRPVYVEQITDPGRPDQMGIVFVQQLIIAAQIDERGHVLYCRLQVGGYESMDGQSPIFGSGQEHVDRARSAASVVLPWLEARFTLQRGLVAFPRDLRLLNGRTDLIRYDKASGLWQPAVEPEPAAAPA